MKGNSNKLRILSALAVVALVCLGLAIHTGTGTPSAWGIYDIAAICPLGAVEAALAARTVVPPLLIGFIIVVVLVVIFGRAFCAWGCPVPLLRRIFGLKTPEEKRRAAILKAKKALAAEDTPEARRQLAQAEAAASAQRAEEQEASGILDIPNNKRGGLADSRNWVLGGTILSTALFGFPVFCLICPVGLTFATIIALWRLFQFNEVVLSLVIFPIILVIEVVFLRKWCSKFCPLGALFSLIARANRTFVAQSNHETCLTTAKGESCHRCVDACPEGIDLHNTEASAPMNECTKCRACADACPMHAITFPFLPKKASDNASVEGGNTPEKR